MKYTYALTIRKTKFPVFIIDYDEWIADFTGQYRNAEIEYHYEAGSGLHLHAIISSNKRVYIDKIHPGSGWNLVLKPVQHRGRWLAYIRKEESKETDLINEEYRLYNHHAEFMRGSEPSISEDEQSFNSAKDEEYIEEYVYPRFDIRKMSSRSIEFLSVNSIGDPERGGR